MYSGIGGDDEEERPKKDEKSCRGRRNSFTTFIKCCKRPITYYESRDRGRLVRKLLHSSILSFFPPPRDDVGFCVYTIYKPQTHTQTYSTFVEWCAHVTKSVEKKFSKHFFFLFPLVSFSLSSFLLLWLFRLQVCVWVRSFVRCGKRLWTSFIHAAAAVMNNGVHWGRCLLFRARLQLRRGANETHIRIELKQFQ